MKISLAEKKKETQLAALTFLPQEHAMEQGNMRGYRLHEFL